MRRQRWKRPTAPQWLLGVFLLGMCVVATAQEEGKPFKDVPRDHWAYQAVADLERLGILKGYPVPLQYDPSSAESAWKSLLRAMQRGDEQTIKKLTTPLGFRTLNRDFNTGEVDFKSLPVRQARYRRYVRSWMHGKRSWSHDATTASVMVRWFPEKLVDDLYVLIFFFKTEEGWKMNGFYSP